MEAYFANEGEPRFRAAVLEGKAYYDGSSSLSKQKWLPD